jgi:FkbM family methyltransferase
MLNILKKNKITAIKQVPRWLRPLLLSLREVLFDVYAIKSYSQEGEDMILNRIFSEKARGFYVDVGAHHPCRFSNTYFFYKKGWSGINIEPNPEVVSTFKSMRSRDINLQVGVSEKNEKLKYYHFDEPALNTFDHNIVKDRLENTSYKVIKVGEIPVLRLDEIFFKHLPNEQIIDFLSVDVEGLDFMVLKSNDWTKYRPTCVLVEVLNSTLDEIMNSDIYGFMKNNGYNLFSRTYNTLIFRETKI